MERRLSRPAISAILEALRTHRKAALLSLPCSTPCFRAALPLPLDGSSTQQPDRGLSALTDVEKLTRDAVREAVLRASEIQRAPSPTSSTHDETWGTKNAKASTPQAEVGSVLEGRRLHQLDLSGTRLAASFNRSDLSQCNFTGSYVAHSTFNLARLRCADLSGAQVHSCTFYSCDAVGVNARRARFSHCVFRQADLRGWCVCGATFFHCTFTLCDLSEWEFDGETVVVEPTDWSRCRRLKWRTSKSCPLHECRVVGPHAARALSLPPATRTGPTFW